MVAVMVGGGVGGSRTKFCATSLLGEGAVTCPPPTPRPSLTKDETNTHFSTNKHNHIHLESTDTTDTAFRLSICTPDQLIKLATPYTARLNTSNRHHSQHLALSMEADTGEYRDQDDAEGISSSQSPQGAAMPCSPSSLCYDNPTSPTSPGDGRRGELKQCGVCGDVAKSNHFGGRSCDSCKAFFRRSVQNSAYRAFTCPYERTCVIAKASRKACQYCRFEKCLSIGMEKGWVMSEAERRKMMEQRHERKIAQQHRPPSVGLSASMARQDSTEEEQGANVCAVKMEEFNLPEDMTEEIQLIEDNYKRSCTANPYKTESDTTTAGSLGVLNTWMKFCEKIGHFFSLFNDYSLLAEGDKSILLKTAMTSAGIIMGSVTFDSWMGKKKASCGGQSIPKVSFENIQRLVPSDLLYRVKVFFKKFQVICPDETMAKILILVTLYSPELAGLQNEHKIQELQDHYIHILECYIKYKYQSKAEHMFAKALVSLADVRELAERSFDMDFNSSALGDLSSSSAGHSSDEWKGGGGSGGAGGGEGGSTGAGGNSGTATGGAFREYPRSGGSCGSSGGGSGDDGAGNDGGTSIEGVGSTHGCVGSESDSFTLSGVSNDFLDGSADWDNFNRFDCDGPYSSQRLQETTMDTSRTDVTFDNSRLDMSCDEGINNDLHGVDKSKLTERQVSDLRIQELFKSMPPPAVMNIIYHMSEDLDIEAKNTECGIKLLRRHGASFASSEKAGRGSGARRKSNSLSVNIKTEIGKPMTPISFMDVEVKEEKMDLDVGSDTIGQFDSVANNDLDSSLMLRLSTLSPKAFLDQPLSLYLESHISQSVTSGQTDDVVSYLTSLAGNTTSLSEGIVPVTRTDQHRHRHQQSYARRHHHHHRHHHASGGGPTTTTGPFGSRYQHQHSDTNRLHQNGHRNFARSASPAGLQQTTVSSSSSTASIICSSNNKYDSISCMTGINTNNISTRDINVCSVPIDKDSSLAVAATPSPSSPHCHQHGRLLGHSGPHVQPQPLSSLHHIQPSDVSGHVPLDNSPNSSPELLLDASSVSSTSSHGSPLTNYVSPLSDGSQSFLHHKPSHHQHGSLVSNSMVRVGSMSPGGTSASPLLMHSPNSELSGRRGSVTLISLPPSSSLYDQHVVVGAHSSDNHRPRLHQQQLQQNTHHACVQQQIMAMSIHSPDSPPDSTNSSSIISSGVEIQQPPQQYRAFLAQLPPLQQLQEQHCFTPPLLQQQNSPSVFSTATSQVRGGPCSSTSSYPGPNSRTANSMQTPSPTTSSPSPSCTSLNNSSSSNSPENSTESFDKSLLYTSPLNLSCLSDVEAAVLQRFFEHISTQLSQFGEEGKPWNSEDILPKPFLAMLQAKLKTEHK